MSRLFAFRFAAVFLHAVLMQWQVIGSFPSTSFSVWWYTTVVLRFRPLSSRWRCNRIVMVSAHWVSLNYIFLYSCLYSFLIIMKRKSYQLTLITGPYFEWPTEISSAACRSDHCQNCWMSYNIFFAADVSRAFCFIRECQPNICPRITIHIVTYLQHITFNYLNIG